MLILACQAPGESALVTDPSGYPWAMSLELLPLLDALWRLERMPSHTRALFRELTRPEGHLTMLVIVAGLLLAWLLARWMSRRLVSRGRHPRVAQWSDRLAWPVLALGLVGVIHALDLPGLSDRVLELGQTLLLALVIIRSLLLLTRQTFSAASAWLGPLERTLSVIIWLGVALQVLGLLPLIIETLDRIAIPLGKSRLSMLQAITGLVTLAVTSLVALWAGSALDARLASTTSVPQGARAVIGRTARPLLLLVALLVTLPLVGIDLTMLSVFGGALGVGLGFGLQKIAANYISGFIILLDQSIVPGRLIRVDRFRGVVSDIRTRYTVLKGLDGVESVVPNEMLVGSVVESETFTDTVTRVPLQLGVSYASDVERAMQIMVEAAQEQPRVLETPPPRAFLASFGDSGIQLELGMWIRDPQMGTLDLRSAINLQILRRFRDEGIEMPFPQREVTLRRAGPQTTRTLS
jgi:small-conductance mechanosensitive channel